MDLSFSIKISNDWLYTFSWNIRQYNITQVNATIWRSYLIIHKINICANIITNMWKHNIITFIGIESNQYSSKNNSHSFKSLDNE